MLVDRVLLPLLGFCLLVLPGLAAVYVLLPRPRRLPGWIGAVLAGVQLLVLGWFAVRSGILGVETLLFYAFATIAIVSGGLLITQSNPARAALAFALVVLSTCGLFLLQAAPFLMAATIIIYAGAIVVTFLFVIMLAHQTGPSDADQRSREPLIAVGVGVFLLGTLLFLLHQSYSTAELDRVVGPLVQRTQEAATKETAEEVLAGLGNEMAFFRRYYQLAEADRSGERTVERIQERWSEARQDYDQAVEKKDDAEKAASLARMKQELHNLAAFGLRLRQTRGQLVPVEDRQMSGGSGPPPNRHVPRDWRGRPLMPAEDTAHLGRSLFTDYLLAFELGGTLLLVATIGAIVIAGRRREQAP